MCVCVCVCVCVCLCYSHPRTRAANSIRALTQRTEHDHRCEEHVLLLRTHKHARTFSASHAHKRAVGRFVATLQTMHTRAHDHSVDMRIQRRKQVHCRNQPNRVSTERERANTARPRKHSFTSRVVRVVNERVRRRRRVRCFPIEKPSMMWSGCCAHACTRKRVCVCFA